MPEFRGLIQSKLPKAGTTIFSVMSQLAQAESAINLSQGFPDFPCSEELIGLVNSSMKKGLNQYAPMQGIMPLREKISEKIQDIYGCFYHPEKEITITAGGTQALYTAISAVIRPGDEVIVFEPCYDSYIPAIEMNGGIPVCLNLGFPGFQINHQELRNSISQKTRMIILNTPHNPTGSVLKHEDILVLEEITQGTDIIILSDEVYEHIIFDGMKHLSMSCFPKLAERSMIIFSFGKTFHVTGWKLGYCLAPEHLMKEFRKIHQFMVFSANTPIQYAVTEFMKDKRNYEDVHHMYEAKRDRFAGLLKASRFKLLPAHGSYFQLLQYDSITDEKDTDYAIRLTKEAGVASIPVSVFYSTKVDHSILRFCFAKTDATLEAAAEKLCKV
jgi:methionine aminotransferase